jgi:5-methylcytosine-specific restriction endonuclease McrA
MARAEFSKATKLARFEHAKGRCEECLQRIIGSAHYDHSLPDALGGENDFANCRCLCVRCHRAKTSDEDVPRISKAKRVYEKRAGVRRTKRPFQARANAWGRERET